MKQLLKDIEKLVWEEYDRATEKFGVTFNGPHEAYAVMLEEYQEARDALDDGELLLMATYWESVKKNDTTREQLANIAVAALHTAAECVQLAAMAHKAIISMELKAADVCAENEAAAATLLPAT